jgi:hypothetical protein
MVTILASAQCPVRERAIRKRKKNSKLSIISSSDLNQAKVNNTTNSINTKNTANSTIGEMGMEKRALFEPGDLIKTFTGDFGLVISGATFEEIKRKVKQGRKPGHFFAAGCPENIDYLLKVPVFFEDGTFDIMKSMNIRKATEDCERKRSKLEEILKRV